MLNFRNLLHRKLVLFLIISALVVAAGFIISNDVNKFVVPTAIGETHKTFVESEDFQYLDRANRAFINLVKHTSPSVVQITTIRELTVQQSNSRYQILPDGFDTEEFRRFFDRFDLDPRDFEESNPNNQIRPRTRQAVGIGSGVIVSDDGYILTNNHVIDKADEIIITLSNGKQYDAELIGTDPAGTEVNGTDLAVLKIDEKGLSALPFGDSDVLEVGEWVVAIGTPFNLSQTVTRGVVSAKDRYRPDIIGYSNFIQTDAPINQGNSGGALINIRGELIGINTLIATNGYAAGNVGIGFAIPSNLASELLPQLIENGKVVRGWLGIRMEVIDHDMAEKLNLDQPRGTLVLEVGQNSPAEKAGIQRSDVILEFNGKTIKDTSHLMRVVAAAGVGTKVNVKVLREGKEMLLTVKLAKRTEEALASFDSSEQPITSQVTLSGMQVQNLTPELARRYGHEDEIGVIVVEVEQRSPAARSGIRPGYLIKEIDYTEIQTIDDFEKIVAKLKDSNEKLALIYFKDLRHRANYETLRIQSDDK